jgi:putative membrane protein
MIRKSMLAFAAVLLAASAGSAAAQSDKDFIAMVMQMNLAEIEMGELAQEKGASEAVREFGQKMIEDHTKANQEASTLAAAEGVTPPAEPTAEAKTMRDELAALSGEAFDRAFAEHMVEDHQKAVDLFKDKADDGDDAVSDFAEKNLPVIQQHLDAAKALPGAPS